MLNYKREVPWSCIGTEIIGAKTSEDAIHQANLDWQVYQSEVYTNGNIIPNTLANIRDADDKVLGLVTSKYEIVQNADAFKFTDSLVDEGLVYERAGIARDGKTIWLLAKLPEYEVLGDKFDNYVCFTNSHDGTSSVKVCVTPIRVWCCNMLNLAFKNARRSWSTVHMGGLDEKLEEARNTLFQIEDYKNELITQADILATTKISHKEVDDLLNILYPILPTDSPRKIENTNAMRDAFYKCYDMKDIAAFKGTAWGVINAYADMIDHTSSLRQSANFETNRFNKLINGHSGFDTLYKTIR